jgi:hypothetical protein
MVAFIEAGRAPGLLHVVCITLQLLGRVNQQLYRKMCHNTLAVHHSTAQCQTVHRRCSSPSLTEQVGASNQTGRKHQCSVAPTQPSPFTGTPLHTSDACAAPGWLRLHHPMKETMRRISACNTVRSWLPAGRAGPSRCSAPTPAPGRVEHTCPAPG